MIHTRQYPFFVYGTLLPSEENYPHYLEGKTQGEEPATISGAALYTDGRYPFLVMSPEFVSPTQHVHGMIMTIRSHLYNDVLKDIDSLEDYVPNRPHNLYERVVHVIKGEHGQGDIPVWVYVAGKGAIRSIRIGLLKPIGSPYWHHVAQQVRQKRFFSGL